MDKKKFGLFIKESRIKKGYTQKELAELLYLDVTAISKWERGVSYPDITLIPDICKYLDVNEHELIESSKDENYARMKKEAKIYSNIRNSIFYISVISYIITIIICFIVNLAVSHKLSWFFVVLSSLICAFTFCPTILRFIKKKKMLLFLLSTFLGLFLLFLTCSIYTKNYWFYVAGIGTLLGYYVVFYPIIFFKKELYIDNIKFSKLKKYYTLTYALGCLLLTIILLFFVDMYRGINLKNSLLIALYAYSILFIYGFLDLFNINRLIRGGIKFLLFDGYLLGLYKVFILLLEDANNNYSINLLDWKNHTNGNVSFLIMLVFGIIGIIFIILGIINKRKLQNNKNKL
ncbi:MAG: helix-turn-helix domain-containing protein [Anaeroplasmataceae bacterium]